jgi:ABC-type phosphate transport system substrate-binding protein
MAIIKLKIRRTSQDGFLAILTSLHLQAEIEGSLPPLPPGLESSFNQWQSAYRQIEDVRSLIAPAPGMRLTPKSVKHYSSAEHTLAVEDQLNQWLNSGDKNWQPIRDKLIAISQQLDTSGEETRVIIDVKDVDLRRLPWQEWNLFEQHYPQTEVALSAPKDKETIKIRPKSQNIRILVVVGRSDGINTADDLKVIRELEKHGATTVILMQPNQQELCEALWDDQGYHIFVFTGHSGSREDGQIGWIELNDKDNLSIQDFKNALKEAINKGLQLAIFNSCDGLGLANQLAQLHLSQCIVMREPVPDKVAIEFLKNFFEQFSANNLLFSSVRTSRKRLEHFQSDYPGAVWLPTICIEPNVEPLTWQKLVSAKPKQVKPNIKPWIITGLASLVVGCGAYFWYILSQISSPEGTFNYGGSTSWAPISLLVDSKITENSPKFKLAYYKHPTLPVGTGTGISMLLDGQISFALASRNVKDAEYQRATSIGVKLKPVAVARDGIAITVHPSLNIRGLSIEQLRKIYTGQITNWQDIGGPNQAIALYIRSDNNSGTFSFFQDNILDNAEIQGKVQIISTTSEALNKVGKDTGDIYFASAPEVINQCSVKTIPISSTVGGTFIAPDKPGIVVPGQKCAWQNNKLNIDAIRKNQYPITRRLFVIVKQNGQDDEKAGDFYAKYLLSPEGQELIEKAGYIREK